MEGIKVIELEELTWSDHRGWVINPFEAAGLLDEKVSAFHVVSMKPGSIRGDHYHTGATEWLMIFGGRAKFAWRSLEDHSINEFVIKQDKPALIEIPPRIEHAVLNESGIEIFLISFSDSEKRDTVRVPSIIE